MAYFMLTKEQRDSVLAGIQSGLQFEIARIEHSVSGQGPYAHASIVEYRNERQNRVLQRSMPLPYDDGLNYCHVTGRAKHFSDIRFGCLNLDILKSMFRGSRALLRRAGFRVATYQTPLQGIGYSGQVMFNIEHATPVQTRTIP